MNLRPTLIGLAVALPGAAALLYGIALIFEPAAWIVGGAGLLLVGANVDVDAGGDQ